jgi:hypothetical protein
LTFFFIGSDHFFGKSWKVGRRGNFRKFFFLAYLVDSPYGYKTKALLHICPADAKPLKPWILSLYISPMLTVCVLISFPVITCHIRQFSPAFIAFINLYLYSPKL